MDRYIIRGGNPLVGEVTIGGAKNAALGILAAAIMTSDPVRIENVPAVTDTEILLKAVEGIGVKITRPEKHTVIMDSSKLNSTFIDDEYMKKIRASYYLVGALLGRDKRAEVPLPGGCNIGVRGIDQHLKGFEALGAETRLVDGAIIEADCAILTSRKTQWRVLMRRLFRQYRRSSVKRRLRLLRKAFRYHPFHHRQFLV